MLQTVTEPINHLLALFAITVLLWILFAIPIYLHLIITNMTNLLIFLIDSGSWLYYYGTTLLRNLSRAVISLKGHFKWVYLSYILNFLVLYLMVYFMFWCSFCSKWLFTQKFQSNNNSVTVLTLCLILQKCTTALTHTHETAQETFIFIVFPWP